MMNNNVEKRERWGSTLIAEIFAAEIFAAEIFAEDILEDKEQVTEWVINQIG
ncbi:MAG: hypothetical protein MUF72_01410 [Elainella sp. Prado103]|jgi:hypothetical protein|nr:hypothetical protein [Elainella sp. Prado103]